MKSIQQLLKTILIIIVFAICSWLLIHVLSVLGIFLAIAYPIWWIFSPKHVVCFFCRTRNEGEFCPFCRKTVIKASGNSPKTFLSASLNGLLVLVISLVSIGLVFAETQLLGTLGFIPPTKTVTFSVPSTGEHVIGELFPMKIIISGIKTPINTVRTDISFNPQAIQVVDISTTDSFANIFIRKDIDNIGGLARLAGGLPNPGFSKGSGLFATFYLRGLKPGITTIKFLPSSIVLANNGKGDNVLKDFGSISYLILPANTITTINKHVSQNINMKVLGTSTSNATQMNFYDDSQVLGASTTQNIDSNPPLERNKSFLENLGQVDEAISNFWEKIFSSL